ncbi:MAG: hypothetical protein ACAH80_16180 [Alphaproteobacteria bacterium]
MDPRIVKKKKERHFEPQCGDGIDECIATSIKEAKALGEPITLHFNDNVLKITGESKAAAVKKEKDEQSRKRWEAYKKTPAYAKAQAREKAERERDQKKIDELMASLDGALAKGIGAAVGWMKDYAAVADNITLKTDHGTVLKKVLAAGYKEDAHVGEHEKLKENYAAAGEYIMGQAIACMKEGFAPHPITGKFAAEFARIRAVKTFPVMHTIKLNGKAPPPDTINLVPQIKFKPPACG